MRDRKLEEARTLLRSKEAVGEWPRGSIIQTANCRHFRPFGAKIVVKSLKRDGFIDVVMPTSMGESFSSVSEVRDERGLRRRARI